MCVKMGANVSRQDDFTKNDFLTKFVGKEHVPVEDTMFWESFLKFHIAFPTNR